MQFYTEHWRIQRWENEHRYYVAEVAQDLFGNWLLTRRWGGRHSQRGNSLVTQADNYDHALQLLESVAKRRRARGYIDG